MKAFVVPLGDPAANDPEQVGPKAANLAQLGQAGLPTPGGFALTAAAYHHQLRHLGIAGLLAQYNAADLPSARKLSVRIRLALYQEPIAPEILEPLLAAWREQRADGSRGVVRSSALIEDRKGANFAGQFESFLGLTRRNRIPDRGARLLGGAVDFACAPLHGKSRALSGRHGDGRADPAADPGARIGWRA